jgi:hypothetical protein
MNHRLSKYSEWCRALLDVPSPITCQIFLEYQGLFGEQSVKVPPNQIHSFGFQLQKSLEDSNFKLQGFYDALQLQLNLNPNDTSYQEIRLEFENYVKVQRDAVGYPFENQLLEELVKLLMRLVGMEELVHQDPGNFVDLLVNDRWAFQELLDLQGFISDVTGVIFEGARNHQLLGACQKAIQEATDSYKQLDQLEKHFAGILLPQILHGIVSQDKSVLTMIADLMNVQKGFQSLEDLSMDLKNGSPEAQLVVQEMRGRLSGMIEEYEGQPEETMGKLIFLGFTRLFESMKPIEKLEIPDHFQNVQEIQRIQEKIQEPGDFEYTMTIQQLQVMIDLFTMCLEIAWSYKGSGAPATLDFELLGKPFRKYLSDFIVQSLLGRGALGLAAGIAGLLEENGRALVEPISLEESCLMGQDKIIANHLMLVEQRFRMDENLKYYQVRII